MIGSSHRIRRAFPFRLKNVRSGLRVEFESGLKKQHRPTVLPQPALECRYPGYAAQSEALQALPPKQSAQRKLRLQKPPATVEPHRTAMQGKIRQLKDRSCAASPNPGINSKHTAQQSRVQHRHRTTLRRAPFGKQPTDKKQQQGNVGKAPCKLNEIIKHHLPK